MKRFQFSIELRKELKENGKSWDDLLFRACMEAKEKEVKASVFAEVLRKTGFRCGTGPARAAYKAVREGGDLKAMVKAITAVKAKRKANKAAADKAAAEAEAAADKAAAEAEAAAEDTLVGALENALRAAISGKLEVAETWLLKANALIATAKELTAQAKKTA